MVSASLFVMWLGCHFQVSATLLPVRQYYRLVVVECVCVCACVCVCVCVVKQYHKFFHLCEHVLTWELGYSVCNLAIKVCCVHGLGMPF